jgi:hypothetical protein
MRNAMKNKTRFQNSTLIALSCLTLTTLACTQSDSLGQVGRKDGGSDGSGKDGNGCQSTNGNPSTCDAPPAPDVSPGPDTSLTPEASPTTGCQYPNDSHVNATGDTVWSWRFHWQDVNLAATCAAWGADAKVILEVDIPANPAGSGTTLPTCALDTLSTGAGPQCAMADAWRFEAVCTDSQLMAELPSINTFHGYYHVESSSYPNSPRHLVAQDIHCSRDLYLPTGIGSPPAITNDGGVDVAPDGDGCGAGSPVHFAAPGCGADAVPMCGSFSQDACTAIIPYCGCDGTTTIQGACGTSPSPYLYAGACKQDGGTDSVPPKTDAGDPCVVCTASQVCVQSFDGTCKPNGLMCRTISDACRSKLSTSGAKSCTSLSECQSELCTSPYQCLISTPCGSEAPQAAIYCYGP